MDKTCRHMLVKAVAVFGFITLFSNVALAAGPCRIEAARTPSERADLWRAAVEGFSASRPNLNAEQTQFLAQAVRLGDEIATLKQDERAQAAFVRKTTRLMERARELFSKNELGALFSSMGQTQVWLAEVIAAEAFCNCVGSGGCTMGPGGPSGSCNAGCTSWDGDDGHRRDGLCGSASEQ